MNAASSRTLSPSRASGISRASGALRIGEAAVPGHSADGTAAISPVLLVLLGGTVSQAAICRTAELAAGAPVTVIGIGCGPGHASPGSQAGGGRGPGAAQPEQVRRAVALAMSALEDTGVAALGHIAVTGSPGRTVARVARARGARIVVLDQAGGLALGRGGIPGGSPGAHGRPGGPGGGLAAELRRRMYGSGITVISAANRAALRPRP